MFTHQQDGFTMRFANGFAVSVRWSNFHYCEHRDLHAARGVCPPASRNAEIAVITPSGDVESPEGWQTPDDLAIIIAQTALRKPV